VLERGKAADPVDLVCRLLLEKKRKPRRRVEIMKRTRRRKSALGRQRGFRTIHHSPCSHLLRVFFPPSSSCHLPTFYPFSRTMQYLCRCERKRVFYVFMHTFIFQLTSVSPSRGRLVRAFVWVSNIVTLWNENSTLSAWNLCWTMDKLG